MAAPGVPGIVLSSHETELVLSRVYVSSTSSLSGRMSEDRFCEPLSFGTVIFMVVEQSCKIWLLVTLVTERISLSLSILFGTEQQVAKSAIERYERKDMKRYRVT